MSHQLIDLLSIFLEHNFPSKQAKSEALTFVQGWDVESNQVNSSGTIHV